MTDSADTHLDILRSLAGDEPVFWITATPAKIKPGDEPYGGRTGWLRFMDSGDGHNIVAGLGLPAAGERVVMSGEWTEGDATTSVSLRPDGLVGRTIAEVAPGTKDALPVVRCERRQLIRPFPDRPAETLVCAAYYGFRSEEDFHDGRLSCVAERFIGFGRGEQS